MSDSKQSIKIDPKEIIHRLLELDKKAQEVDEKMQDIRVGIHNLVWDVKERQLNE